MNVAVILAGGIGARVGAEIPKQFIKILDKPILAYTLELYQNNENIDAIEVVCHKDWKDEVRAISKKYGIHKLKWVVDGGNTFQESVMNGVFNLKNELKRSDIIVLAIGVSPLTSNDVINDSINVCKKNGNGIASQDMTLCTCIKYDEISTVENISRETIKGFITPWSFNFGELYDVYRESVESGIIDLVDPYTTSLYLKLGKRLYFSKTNSANIKITTQSDLDFFEGYILLKEKRKNKGVLSNVVL